MPQFRANQQSVILTKIQMASLSLIEKSHSLLMSTPFGLKKNTRMPMSIRKRCRTLCLNIGKKPTWCWHWQGKHQHLDSTHCHPCHPFTFCNCSSLCSQVQQNCELPHLQRDIDRRQEWQSQCHHQCRCQARCLIECQLRNWFQ